jgi:hypothetical protein
MIDPTYLPFPAGVVRKYFGWWPTEGLSGKEREAAERAQDEAEKNVAKFIASAKRRQGGVPDRIGQPLSKLSSAYQMEKDETFWTASTWISVFESQRRKELLLALLQKALAGRDPMPLDGDLTTWERCLEGRLSLRLEAVHPSPEGYKRWLEGQYRDGGDYRHLIPHVVDSAMPLPGKSNWKNLEGGTHVDALIVNEDNGFAVAIEAKVLSDISAYVTYDMRRNQMARNLDVMMDDASSNAMRYDRLEPSIRARRSDRTLFLIQTPRVFQKAGRSRLYWYKFHEYTVSDAAIHADLPHRSAEECAGWSRRIGWLTWEDCCDVDATLCGWLKGHDQKSCPQPPPDEGVGS